MNHSVFRDLIPGYIENLTSEETNKQIEKHMEQCEDCRQYVKDMQEDLLIERTHEQKKTKKNIDFFKKVRSKNRKKIFIIVGSLLSIFIGCFSSLIKGGLQMKRTYKQLSTNKVQRLRCLLKRKMTIVLL